MTSRSRLLSTIRTIGVAVPGPPVGPTSAPGCTLRSVTTPPNGAVIRRYPSMSLTDLSAWRAASTFCCAAAIWLWSASTAFCARTTSLPATTPGVADAAFSFSYVLASRRPSSGRPRVALRRSAASTALRPSARRVPAPRARPAARPRGRATRDRRVIVFTKPVHSRIQRDGLVGRQLARQRQRHVERLFDDLDDFDRSAVLPARPSRRSGPAHCRDSAAMRQQRRARRTLRALATNVSACSYRSLPAIGARRIVGIHATAIRRAPTAARANTPTAARSTSPPWRRPGRR